MNDYTMYIDGVPGELTLKHANGEHAVEDLEYSFRGPGGTPNSHNGTTGHPVVDHFSVTLPTAKSMAMLIGKLFSSKHIPTVRITLWAPHDGQTVKYEVYTLIEVRIGEFAKIAGKSEGAGTNRRMSFKMRQIKVESFAPDGSAVSSATYDFLTAC